MVRELVAADDSERGTQREAPAPAVASPEGEGGELCSVKGRLCVP